MSSNLNRSLPIFFAVTGLLVALAAPLAADPGKDWPQFRGPDRNGTSTETIAHEWSEDGPKEVWRVALGPGYSAPSIVGDRVYVMYAAPGADDAEKHFDYAVAIDKNTGKEIWRTVMSEMITTEFGDGPRSTPTVEGDTVYALDASGEFAALAAADGSKKWTVSFGEDYGTDRPYWGFSTSPVVYGDAVLIETGGSEGKCYAAFNKKTGEETWTHGDAPPGYNSPLHTTLAGKEQFVVVAGGKVFGVDREGTQLWEHPFQRFEAHAMPVLVGSDQVYVSGTGGGALMLKISKGDDGLQAEEVWTNETMRNHFSSVVTHNGTIFGFDNATFKAISAETGEVQWAKRGFGKGSVMLADGHLLILSDSGTLVLAEAGSEKWVEKGRVQALEGRCWTAPVLADGRLYVRNHEEMVVYDLNG